MRRLNISSWNQVQVGIRNSDFNEDRPYYNQVFYLKSSWSFFLSMDFVEFQLDFFVNFLQEFLTSVNYTIQVVKHYEF